LKKKHGSSGFVLGNKWEYLRLHSLEGVSISHLKQIFCFFKRKEIVEFFVVFSCMVQSLRKALEKIPDKHSATRE
jgi:hypothetical protein